MCVVGFRVSGSARTIIEILYGLATELEEPEESDMDLEAIF